VIYVTCSNGLHALALNTTAKTFAPVSGWTVNANAIAPPIFAGGLVWSVGTGNGVLYGLDPATGASRFSASLGGFEHFSSPSAGGGRLFVANRDLVTAFQIATAPGPSATSVAISSSKNPTPTGQGVSYTATVSPTPDAGTVRFSDGGAAIAGCSAVAVNAVSGQGVCTTSFSRSGTHAIVATYSGDTYFAASGSAALSQVVLAPVISHLHAKAVHGKLWLSLTLSEPAKLTVVVLRIVSGRIVHSRCRAGASHGRRCRASLRKATLLLNGKRGRNTFKPRMRALASASYIVSVTARDAGGGRSRRYATSFVVRRA